MKKIQFWFLILFSSFIYSQTNGISYQVVILDPNGNTPLANQTICLQFKILNSSSLIDYQETITSSTDDFGMINTIIGSGLPSGGSAATFNDIVWNKTSKSLIVEVDLNGTCSSFVEISNQPFTSVPFALHATNGGSTNLSFTAGPTNGVVVSDTGDDAIVPIASETNSGLLAPNEYIQLLNLTSNLANKQDVLVDAVNIKTINGNSLLGNGDLAVEGKISQTITNDVTTTAPSEDVVYDALDLKINKNTSQIAEMTPINLFKINPFTAENENFGLDFNSFTNSGAGAGTYNHGTWLGYNTGWHSGQATTAGKPSIMIGLEDNYFDHIGDLQFGTEFYVQGFSPNGTTIQLSRPYYARGAQNDDGTDWWSVISNIGSKGANRSFTVREGVNNLFQITPTSTNFYTAETRINNILKVQSGNILMDNGRYFQYKNNAGGVASVFNLSPDNTFYIGDIFNNIGGNVILRSGGLSSLTLNPLGDATFYGATTATSFIKSGGTSAQFLMADGSVSTPTIPLMGTGQTGFLPKFTGTTTLDNSAIIENGSSVSLNYPATASIDTRLSISNSGNGGAGRGTAIVMGVPGSSSNVDGVKINVYTVGGATATQSADLAFDVALSGTLTERMRMTSNGNLLIGTTTDDNLNKLQVNGTTTATSFIKSGGTSSQFLKADGSIDATIYQPLLNNPVTGSLAVGYLPKVIGTSILGNSAIQESGSSVLLNYPATANIDTRLSISNSGNGGAGRGTAIVMGVPGSSSNIDGVKINAYTVGGATASQSADLAFDVALSGELTERMRMTSNGNLLIGTTTDDNVNKLQVSGTVESTQYKLSALNIAPVSATAPGTLGEIRYDENYMYLCVATNTWKRSSLKTW